MSNNSSILLIYPPTNKNYGLYNDLEDDKRVILRCAIYKQIKGSIFSRIRRLYFSKKINRIIDLPYKEWWYEYHDIYTLLPNLQYILVIDLALNSPPLLPMLKECRKRKPDLKIGLYYLNALGTTYGAARPKLSSAIDLAHRFQWDDVFTFDPFDAEKYNMTYWGFNYYSKKEIKDNRHPKHDLYYIGIASDDRNNMFADIYKHLTEEGCDCDFYLKPISKEHKKIEGITYVEGAMRPYESVLNDLQNSKCILEILRDNQFGPSLRYFEAVCYNKKLITNNPYIRKFPYYNEEYMKIISSSKDIDIKWLKNENMQINYHYNGDFSPKVLINQLANK